MHYLKFKKNLKTKYQNINIFIQKKGKINIYFVCFVILFRIIQNIFNSYICSIEILTVANKKNNVFITIIRNIYYLRISETFILNVDRRASA